MLLCVHFATKTLTSTPIKETYPGIYNISSYDKYVNVECMTQNHFPDTNEVIFGHYVFPMYVKIE